MIRNILSVIAGYFIFVVSSLVLFKFSGQPPHAEPTTNFVIFTAVYGIVFSFISGFVTKLIAATKKLTVNYVLLFIMAGFATFSFFKADGNHWTQLLAIFIFAPISVLGGLFYQERFNK